MESSQAGLAQAQVQDAQVVKVELRVKLSALLVHGVVASLLINFASAIAGLVEAALLTIRACLVILVELEKQLHCLVVFALLEGKLGSEVRQEALGLLARWLAKALFKLGGILMHACPVLIGFFEAFLCGFAVFLEQFEQGFEGVEKHLVLLNVYVLGRDGVLAEVGAKQDAVGILAHDVLLNAFHARYAPLLLLALFLCSILLAVLGCRVVRLLIASIAAGPSRRLVLECADLLLLPNDVLEVLQLDLEQEYDRLGWLALPELVQCLQQQEQGFDLQESLNVLNLLQQRVEVGEALAELLRLEGHRSAVVQQDRVEIHREVARRA